MCWNLPAITALSRGQRVSEGLEQFLPAPRAGRVPGPLFERYRQHSGRHQAGHGHQHPRSHPGRIACQPTQPSRQHHSQSAYGDSA